jgi:hypothetical protein
MTNKERILAHNNLIDAAITKANSLPDIGSGGAGDNFIEQDATSSYTNETASRIGSYKFCSNIILEEISLPSCVSIGEHAFEWCEHLTSLYLPSCKRIEAHAFEYCTSLTSVSLPSCEFIGGGCFADCTSLKSLILPGETIVTLATEDALMGTIIHLEQSDIWDDVEGKIYVPANLVEQYKTATNWSYYTRAITAIPGT